jgi:glutaminyl-tRNA synthetase
MTSTVLSKRVLRRMVEEKRVSGWDDPRMPTLRGMRRRGYTPEAIREFLKIVGVDKTNSIIDIELLEHCLRQDLNKRAPRRMAVLRPLRLVIDNYPAGQVEEMECINNPEDPSAGTRRVPFSGVLYIEQSDFMEEPPKKFWRLFPGNEVRLRYAYLVTCTRVLKDERGEIAEVHCTYDPATRGGDAPDGRKVKSTLHWVSAAHAVEAEVRLYDRLFTKPNPMEADEEEEGEGVDFLSSLNPNSLEVLPSSRVEPSLKGAPAGSIYQFERQGYFCVDPDSAAGKVVFNRAVALRDTWAKIAGAGGE